MQTGSQNGEKNKTNKRTKEFYRRRAKKMEIRNLSDVEFRIMMSKKLNSMRKDRATMKEQLEIKNGIALIRNIFEDYKQSRGSCRLDQ